MKRSGWAVITIVIGALGTSAEAALVPVFQYSASAAMASSLSTNPTIADASAAGNAATAAWFNSTSLVSPPTASMSGLAWNFNDKVAGKSAAIITQSTVPTLWSVDKIAAAGGFTIDVWFNTASSSGTQRIIDRGGFDSLYLTGNKLQFYFNGMTTNLTTAVAKNQWYHVQAIFDTAGNTASLDSAYKSDRIVGTAALVVNDVTIGTQKNVSLSGAADAAKHPTSIGRNWDGFTNGFAGQIYNPSLFLGTSLPEPMWLGVTYLSLTLCLRRVRG